MEASSEIELHPGGRHHLMLGSPGSTGYAWEFKVDGPPGVILVGLSAAEQSPHVQPSVLQTYSVEQTYVIEALGPGTAEAQFVLRRPWEKEVPPARVISVRVNVVR